MMDELPAIIHRLSLELLSPDQAKQGTETPQEDADKKGIDPFASPPLDPVDAHGNLLDYNTVSELTLNGGGEVQSLFSQKNLLRLAALTDSHRTLSLFTPGINDVVFRAWTGFGARSESASPPFATPSLAKTYSLPAGGSTTYTFSDSGSTAHGYFATRPAAVSIGSSAGGLSHGASHRSRPGRKKKTRVVNLRRSKSEAGSSDVGSEDNSDTASINVPASEPARPASIPEERELEDGRLETSPSGKVRFQPAHKEHAIPIRQTLMSDIYKKKLEQLAAAREDQKKAVTDSWASEKALQHLEKDSASGREAAYSNSDTSSVILEQAWIMKMAGEIARRVYDEKQRHQGIWEESQNAPPPAYEASP